ncbi:hypothetical protein OUZ56_032724 [Daphnia magna]|uniref:Uncharacterized protein n=1 Tax=Daphnia magna TaxID=35525 RepID=A0ABQ9ZWX7_9CRUS|nr:hypothetical protein OUZ56_032724 [Daphnia magna]
MYGRYLLGYLEDIFEDIFAFMRKRSMLNGLTLNENDKSARIMPIAARIIILYIYSFTINLIITTYSTHMTLTL